MVFLRGLNRELIPHRGMGGGNEGDVRRIVADLGDRAALPPLIVAGPNEDGNSLSLTAAFWPNQSVRSSTWLAST